VSDSWTCCAGYALGRGVYGTVFTSSKHCEITMQNPAVRYGKRVPVEVRLRKWQVPYRVRETGANGSDSEGLANSHGKIVGDH